MNAANVLPTRSAYRDLLSDLLRRTVTVSTGGPQSLGGGQRTYLATYRDDDDRVVAVLVLELALATALAAALMMAPPWETRHRVEEEGHLDEELHDALHEVCNVVARMNYTPNGPPARLAGVQVVPGGVARDVARVVRRPRARQDWHVEVQGYGAGLLTLLT